MEIRAISFFYFKKENLEKIRRGLDESQKNN